MPMTVLINYYSKVKKSGSMINDNHKKNQVLFPFFLFIAAQDYCFLRSLQLEK